MSINTEEFLTAYVAAALWSSVDDDGNPLDDGRDIDDIDPETLEQMRADCVEFVASAGELLEKARDLGDYAKREEWSLEDRAGHDFWLTRCGHGAGFWDRELGEIGDQLSDLARAAGNVDLYVGDDGRVRQ